MKRLDRYLLKELVVPFIIGSIAVVLMFQINTYIWVGKNFNLENIPPLAIIQYIIYQTPEYLNMTLAVGTALGSSLAMSRIARESELTAIRATGTSVLRVLAPFVFAGSLVAVGNFFVEERVMPPASKKAREIETRIGVVGMAGNLKENAIIPLPGITIMVGTVERQDVEHMSLERVLILKQEPGGEVFQTIAPTGKYSEGIWSFDKARVLSWKGDDLRVADAGQVVLHERILTDALFQQIDFSTQQTVEELAKNISIAKAQNANVKAMEVQFHTRYSIPAACIVFALVGPIFAIIFARSGGFVGVLLSIVMVLIYYNAFVISTEILSKFDLIAPWLAAWLPNILFAVLGVIGIRRIE